MSFKDFLNPEELGLIEWTIIVFVLMAGIFFLCNWLNYAVWP